MGLVAAADMEVGLVAAKTELEVWLVWKEAGKGGLGFSSSKPCNRGIGTQESVRHRRRLRIHCLCVQTIVVRRMSVVAMI